MYYLFTKCGNGDWDIVCQSRSLGLLQKYQDELSSHGIITDVIGW